MKDFQQIMRVGWLLACLAMCPLFGNILGAQAPDWQVDAEDYQYNMTVVGRVYLDLEPVNTDGNILGAFVGDEVRGVAYPLNIDGAVYYFLTIYSNSVSGDSIRFKVYLQSTDSVYDARQVLVFHKDAAIGSISDPYHIDISSLGDFPIELLDVPADTTLEGIPFDTVSLSEYLITYDNDPIAWAVVPGANLSATLTGDRLFVDSASPGWTGTDSILIIATETGTLQQYADSAVAWYTILPNYIGPVFSFIPAQYAVDGLFADKDINDYLLYEGDCLEYDAGMVRFEDTLANPAWTPPAPGAGAMDLVLQLTFNSMDLADPGTLAGFVNGQLAGVATEVPIGEDVYYFLSLANIAAGSIEFQFYDETYQYLYEVPTSLAFIPGGSAGSAVNPVMLELAPLTISIDTEGIWSAMILDTTFTGNALVEFRVHDCDFPSKNDTIQVPFIWSQCENTSWDICPGDGLCVTADTSLESVVWFRNGDPLHDRHVLSVFQPGVYHYQGLYGDGTGAFSCPVTVNEGPGCAGEFPSINFQDLSVDSLTLGQEIVLSEASVQVNDFDVHWNGNGGDNLWTNADNWEIGAVPNQCQHAIIPIDAEVLITPGYSARIWRLSILSNGVLTVQDSGNLQVIGN